MTSKKELLARAKAAVERLDRRNIELADALAKEEERGTSRAQMAERLGRPVAWVDMILEWRRNGFEGEPFGPDDPFGPGGPPDLSDE